MAYFIDENCISCGSCESICPVGAISEGKDTFVIDEDICTDCGACGDICPSDAIHPKK